MAKELYFGTERASQVRVMKKKERVPWSHPAPVHKFIGVSGRTLDRDEGMLVEGEVLRAATANTSAITRQGLNQCRTR